MLFRSLTSTLTETVLPYRTGALLVGFLIASLAWSVNVDVSARSVVRNLGVPLHPITTANFDFIQHYRPLQNVVTRPTRSERGRKSDSRGYAITGHHELLMPLVAAALAAGWPKASRNAKPAAQGQR